MPIKIDKLTFESFAAAVRHVMRKRKLTKERAQAYVASIERKQKGKNK